MRKKATSVLSYFSSRVVLIVKVPSMPASPAGTFFTWGAATLGLLLLEHSGMSSMDAVDLVGAHFPDSLPEVLQSFFFPLLSLAGTAAAAASATIASWYILSTQMIASISSNGMVVPPIGLGLFRVL